MSPLSHSGAESEVARLLKERVERLREGLENLTREFLEPLPLPAIADRPAAGTVESEALAESVRSLAASEEQISLLDRLLEGAARCCSRVCLFVVRGNSAYGWHSVGFPEADKGDPIKGVVVPLQEDSILRAAADSLRPVRRDIAGGEAPFLPPPRPGDRLPGRVLAAPLLVRGKVAGVLYADDGGDGRGFHDAGTLEVLVSVASLAANRLALLPRQPAAGREAPADVRVRVPAAPEGEGLPPEPDFFGPDPLEDEFSLPAAPSPAAAATGAASLSAEERLLHDDARRFARLLISEILLYNEDQVILGRKQRDLYSRLKEEIDRSRQAYEQRVPGNVTAKADYFREELVRSLAGGDLTALGPGLAS